MAGLTMVLWLVLAIIAIILIAVILVLAIPVHLQLQAASAPERRVLIRLGLFDGHVRWISLVDSSRPPKDNDRRHERSNKARKHRRSKARRRNLISRIITAGPDLVRGLLHSISFERVRLNCRFGLDDPADTGQVYGLLTPWLFATPLGWSQAGPVRVTPVFDRRCLEGDADIALVVTPWRFVPPALRFVWRALGPWR
ncbi:MAG: DUF2953 domain-containing protein [Burkholderiaceae bacterium]